MSTQEWDTRVCDNVIDALTLRVVELVGNVARLERRLAEQGEAERAWILAALRAHARAERLQDRIDELEVDNAALTAQRDQAIADLLIDSATVPLACCPGCRGEHTRVVCDLCDGTGDAP